MVLNKSDPIYSLHPWSIVESQFQPAFAQRSETIFAVGNGYIGMRANYEEGFDSAAGASMKGTYLNAFYDSTPIVYGENAYGYARNRQTMLNVTSSQIIELTVDGERFIPGKSKITAFERTLDMWRGVMKRDLIWETSHGKKVRIHSERLVSLSRKHLAAFSYEVHLLSGEADVSIVSALDGEVFNRLNENDQRVGAFFDGQVLTLEERSPAGERAYLRQRTKTTRFVLICAMDNHLRSEAAVTRSAARPGQRVEARYSARLTGGQSLTLEKHVAYYTSKDYTEGTLVDLAMREVAEARERGFAAHRMEQEAYLADFWSRADVQVHGDEFLQQGIRFNVFHLLQSVGKDGRTNIAAKGVTGEGYEGHYFWDTETYIFPVFLYSHPEICKALLEHRYWILPRARERAKTLAHKGALYAWRTIDGDETSAYYAAGTAQYHINADIIHALKMYYEATGDKDFLIQKGAEMLFETSRFWVDLGAFIAKKGFCINGVTGPDEYTTVVNNNFYTNVMVKDHLEFAVEIAEMMQAEGTWASLAKKLALEQSEVELWRKAAAAMYTKYDEELGIYAQDDSFLEKAPWDFAGTLKDQYPLLHHFHPLNIYRHQVLKQADVVLALLLLGHHFSLAEKKRNFDFYEKLSTHDSSLSVSVHGILAAELGYIDKAYFYFMQTARMDLDDLHGNVRDGVHCAAMAGSWLGLVQGFGGMRVADGVLTFAPVVPPQWQGFAFSVTFRNRLIKITIDRSEATYLLAEGEPIEIRHRGRVLSLTAGSAAVVNIAPHLEAVIFDLDGVITDTAEFHYLGWKRLADDLGVPFDRHFNEKLRGLSRLDSLRAILDAAGRKYTDQELTVWAEQKNRYYVDSIGGLSPKDLLSGVKELLASLKKAGIKIAIASASKNAGTVLKLLGVGEMFDAVIDGTCVKKGKPDPEVFLTAAEKMAVDPALCVGVEDAVAGVEAIRHASMVAIGVGSAEFLGAADRVVASSSELSIDLFREALAARDNKRGIQVQLPR